MEPTLTGEELSELVQATCSSSVAIFLRNQYRKLYTETELHYTRGIGAKNKEHIFALLDENPNLSSSKLAELVNCHPQNANRIRKQYAKIHGKVKIINNQEIGTQIKEIIFALLDKDPTLSGINLAKLANCSKSTAKRHKQRWLELQAEQGKNRKTTHPKMLHCNKNRSRYGLERFAFLGMVTQV